MIPELLVRLASAVAIGSVAALALWLGGMAWTVFVLAVGIGVWFEWKVLVLLFTPPGRRRNLWLSAGSIYAGIAAAVLLSLRDVGAGLVLAVLLAVIATDVGAYFAGRAIGGPKIAPAISPAKTWAGLIGGVVLAAMTMRAVLPRVLYGADAVPALTDGAIPVAIGALLAIVAQAGDFFESWMKRRAGVKDSGSILPGHGGLFDRVDGLVAVLFLLGITFIVRQVGMSI